MKRYTLFSILCFACFMLNAQNITLSFENPEVTTEGADNFYEVDVMITSDAAFSMGSGQFFLDYNSLAFGTQVDNNGAIEYERPENTLLGGEVIVDVGGTPVPLGAHYTSFVSNDTTNDKVSFIWLQNASSGMYGENIPAGTAVPLVHLKIRFLPGAEGEDPNVCFDATNPFDDQFFTACGPFDPLIGFDFEGADCQGEPGVQIFDYVPNCDIPEPFEISCQDITVQLDANGAVTITPEAVFNGDANDPAIDTLTLDQTSFECNDLGANTVTLTVTNTSGDTDSCTATVTVEDNMAPVVLCQDSTVQLDANGQATIIAGDVDNGSTDNCSIASIAIDQTSFNCNDIGTNSITLTVTDTSGNTASCTATITVEDNFAPEALCQDTTIQLDANGQATISAGDVDNGSTDNCGIASIEVSQTTFDASDIGANTVTLTVTDTSGNVAMCQATVTVVDGNNPVAVCQNVTIQLDAGGNASITAADVDGGSTDDIGIASIVVDQTNFDCNDLGANTVTLTVTDTSGNTDTCTATITVEDSIAPDAVCRDITVALDANGNASISATDVDNGSTDNCGIASISVSPMTFDASDIGANTVTLTVTDTSGNEAMCQATVTVVDDLAPVAVCQNVTIQLDAAGNASITAADVDGGSTDNVDIASIEVDQTSFNCNDLGANTIALTVTDTSGNSATCSATVTVEDSIAPVALCQDITVALDANGNASITPADIDGGSTDNCGIDLLSISQTTFSCADIGNNTVTLTVTDTSGNVATCNATVTIEDTTGPEVTCPGDQTIILEAGTTTFEVPDYFSTGEASAIDNCTDPVSLFTQDPMPGELLEDGTYTVTLCATDEFGNENCCEFELVVDDQLGIEDIAVSTLKMYPNPARNTVNIANPNGLEIDNITIYDARGRSVANHNLQQTLTEIPFDISNLSSGSYFVRIQGSFGVSMKQLIKEN